MLESRRVEAVDLKVLSESGRAEQTNQAGLLQLKM